MVLFAAVLLIGSWLPSSQVESKASGNEPSNNIKASMSMGLHQNLVAESDMVVESGTYLIENTDLNLTGKITARNDAAIIIRNATLHLTTRDDVVFREGIVLMNKSKLIAENATIFLKSTNIIEDSYITVGDEATANITDSELYGIAIIIGRQNSRTYVNRSVLKGPNPSDLELFTVLTEDNSTARIQHSDLDSAQARGNSSVHISDSNIKRRGIYGFENGLIEIENSLLGTVHVGLPQAFSNSTLRILNSTVGRIVYRGFELSVRDSTAFDLWLYGNSTAWFRNVSVSRIVANGNSTVWLINSYSKEIESYNQGKVYVGWQLPLFGIVAFPYTWLPVLQGIAVLGALVIVIALLVVFNRRWKRRQLQKLKQQTKP